MKYIQFPRPHIWGGKECQARQVLEATEQAVAQLKEKGVEFQYVPKQEAKEVFSQNLSQSLEEENGS